MGIAEPVSVSPLHPEQAKLWGKQVQAVLLHKPQLLDPALVPTQFLHSTQCLVEFRFGCGMKHKAHYSNLFQILSKTSSPGTASTASDLISFSRA